MRSFFLAKEIKTKHEIGEKFEVFGQPAICSELCGILCEKEWNSYAKPASVGGFIIFAKCAVYFAPKWEE